MVKPINDVEKNIKNINNSTWSVLFSTSINIEISSININRNTNTKKIGGAHKQHSTANKTRFQYAIFL